MASNEPLKIHDFSDDVKVSFDASITSESAVGKRKSKQQTNSIKARPESRSSIDKGSNFISSQKVVLFARALIGITLFIAVLGASVLSKLTLFSLTDRLRSVTTNVSSTAIAISQENHVTAVAIYWYLQFILLIPSLITFIRCLVVGVVGKTSKSFPWPTWKAVIIGSMGTIMEVLAMSTFLYFVLPRTSPGVGIFLLCGVFFCQICIDVYNTPYAHWCQNTRYGGHRRYEYDPLTISNQKQSKFEHFVTFVQIILENKLTKVIALILQVTGIVVFAAASMAANANDYTIAMTISYVVIILILSVVWSDWYQRKISEPFKKNTIQQDKNVTARYKSCYITSGLRLFLYPFVSYIIFRYASGYGDPWCLHNSCSITLNGDELPAMIVQVVVTLLGYAIGWAACNMTLSRLSMALPLLLSTPVTVVWYYLSSHAFTAFPHFTAHTESSVETYLPIALSLLWLCEIISMGYFLLVKTSMILSDDSEMFLMPHYDGVFFEQHMILNRQTNKDMMYKDIEHESGRGETIRRHPRTVFVCSTMYRENDTEMKQMLISLYNLANHFSTLKNTAGQDGAYDRYESHIFFDGAINDTQIQEFGLQLLSLLKETLRVKLKRCKREKTPYGYRLSWDIGLGDMPFTVHFKDKSLVKPKKRWSQVMYMNYVLNYRLQTDDLNASDTFILTTDADIDFTPKSVDVLLDMFACNKQVGAVCARTHPKGSGPIYWYQVFDYAIGHWFQKPAEHILGCVLCSPGCFSVYRCSALADVLDTYSTEVTGASEFLMKDMGEDRWLCTLLIKAGWRLEYCAISEDQTYCPTDFGEFFKQRRRWIPSTIANLVQLISSAGSITRKNDSVSLLFILFQAIMVFSTAISPATVILVISSGLQSAYNLSLPMTLVVICALIAVSVFYGLVCVYASPQTQIDMAKVLSFVFAIIMSVVVVGIFKEVVYDIYGGKGAQVLRPPNCTNSSNQEVYDDCIKSARYIEELVKSLYTPSVQIPVSMTVIYLGAFAVTFSAAALLHLPEWYCLLHCVWYLLALPSGYLLLLIYSAANLDSQSWGTREGSSGKDKGLIGWLDHIKNWRPWKKASEDKPKPNLLYLEEEAPHMKDKLSFELATEEPVIQIDRRTMDDDTRLWLTNLECGDYAHNFEEHGYVNKHFIAAMKPKDFEAIGINKRGFRLRLQNAAKRLPSLPIYTDVPANVEQWLERLEIPEYTPLFHQQGYKSEEDIENLKDLTDDDLRAMGISKMAHLQRLRVGIDNLVKPTALELRIRHTETVIDNLPATRLESTSPEEADFWIGLIHRNLKPVSIRFQGQVEDLKKSLLSLRNAVLAGLFLVNIVWIILLYTLEFPELQDYGLDSRGFQLLFLAVYGFIIVVQFITLVLHRIVTLIHYFGRLQPSEVTRGLGDSIEVVKTYEVRGE